MSLFGWWRNTFTIERWKVNPFQMYDISMLATVAIAQVVLGASPNTVQENISHQTLVPLALCNVVGSSIALLGLHLRDLESGLWVELWGYLCLVFVLIVYLSLLFHGQVNATATYGFGFAEAFLFASLHRSINIALYKRVRRKKLQLANEAIVLREALQSVTPDSPGGDRG